MSHYNAKPIRLDLRPSRLLAGILIVAAIAACGAIAVLPMGCASCLPIIAAAAFHVMRDTQLWLRSSILALEVGSDGTFRYLTRIDGWREAVVRGDSFVMPALTVLVLASEGKYFPRYAILLSGSADSEMLRRMRVWLRWGSQILPEKN